MVKALILPLAKYTDDLHIKFLIIYLDVRR